MAQPTNDLQEVAFNNLNYTAKALGLAMRRRVNRSEPGMVYYVSFAGTNTACESIRASLHKRGAKLPDCRWSRNQEPIDPGMTTAKRKLPNSIELHYIVWSQKPEVIIIRDDRMLLARQTPSIDKNEKIAELKKEYKAQLEQLFTQAINAISKAPMLPEWAEKLMDATRNEGWEKLDTYGDVVHAILLNKEYNWSRKLRSLLTDGAITIPPLEPDLMEMLAASQARLVATIETIDVNDDAEHLVDLDTTDIEAYITPASKDATLPRSALTTDAKRPFLFKPGQIVATTNFAQTVGTTFDAVHYLYRHLTGDWREAEMSLEDIKANQRAARSTGDNLERVFSAFHHPDDHGPDGKYIKFWVITEADRSATTFLMPADY